MKFSCKKILTLSFLATALAFAGNAQAESKATLNVLTYDSFKSYGVAKALSELFEPQCNCTLNWQTTKHQHLLLSTYTLTAKKRLYDAIVGLNFADAQKVSHSEKVTKYFTPINFTAGQLTAYALAGSLKNTYSLPISYSPVTISYNQELQPSLNPEHYKSFNQWLEQDQASFIFADPKTNDLSSNLLKLIAYYYPSYEQQVQAWKKIQARTVTVGTGWSSSYGVYAKGESQEAIAYGSSIIYHRLVENKLQFANLQFAAGMPLIADHYVIAANSKQQQLAQQFAQFLLTPEAQKILFLNNSSYPVVDIATQATPAEQELLTSIKYFRLLDLSDLEETKLESAYKAYQNVFAGKE